MTETSFNEQLLKIFTEKDLFGFSGIDAPLAEKTGCKCVLVTLQPYPDLQYAYNAAELFNMLGELRKKHAGLLDAVKLYLDMNQVKYALPPTAPGNDEEYRAEFSEKWAAIHAGLGFIGKNDVFVHYKYAQRVRISCLLIDFDLQVFNGEIISRCDDCDMCVRSCPSHFLTAGAGIRARGGRSFSITKNARRKAAIPKNTYARIARYRVLILTFKLSELNIQTTHSTNINELYCAI